MNLILLHMGLTYELRFHIQYKELSYNLSVNIHETNQGQRIPATHKTFTDNISLD